MNRLFRKRPRHRCIAARRPLDAIDIEEEGGPGRYGLYKDRGGSANERGHNQQITRPGIPHGDLAAVASIHVDAKQTLEDDSQSLSVRFGVHGMPAGNSTTRRPSMSDSMVPIGTDAQHPRRSRPTTPTDVRSLRG
jgi:hypothetical protein